MNLKKKICDYNDEQYTAYLEDIFKIRYKKIYKKKGNNCYKALSEYKYQFGVYIFIEGDSILYVGESREQDLYTRVQQHFRDCDSGGLRWKLRNCKEKLGRLSNSELYIIPIDGDDKREILFMENFLISKLRPEFNY